MRMEVASEVIFGWLANVLEMRVQTAKVREYCIADVSILVRTLKAGTNIFNSGH